jgi:anti-anti-sigma factor
MSQELTFEDHKTFKNLISQIENSGRTNWVFDVSGLTNVDSAGLGMLLYAHEQAQQHNWSLKVAGPQGQVRKMLELTQLGRIMQIQTDD